MAQISAGSLLSRWRNTGSILVIVSWVLVFFVILNIAIYNIVSSQMRIMKFIEGEFIGEHLAKSAFVYAYNGLYQDTQDGDINIKLGAEVEKELGQGGFKYFLYDESSKLNINYADLEMIARLPGMDLETANEVYTSPYKPFRAKESLLSIDGFTTERYNKIKDFITVFGSGSININTAAEEALLAVGFDDAVVSQICQLRAGRDGQEGTGDDELFKDMGEFADKINFSSQQKALLKELLSTGTLTTLPDTLRLEADIFLSGRRIMRYSLIFDKCGIKQWREY